MATIGSFKKVGNDFQGEIVTLSLHVLASLDDALALVPAWFGLADAQRR